MDTTDEWTISIVPYCFDKITILTRFKLCRFYLTYVAEQVRLCLVAYLSNRFSQESCVNS